MDDEIIVDNKWTYYTGHHRVDIGDKVKCPVARHADAVWIGEVTGLGALDANYTGKVNTILGVVGMPPKMTPEEQKDAEASVAAIMVSYGMTKVKAKEAAILVIKEICDIITFDSED